MRRAELGIALTAFAAAATIWLAALPASRAGPAAEKPNFSGTWKLNPARSAFGDIPGGKPRARTDLIEQRGSALLQTLYLDRGSGIDTTVYRYRTDSTTARNRVDGQEIVSHAWWRGDTLRLESRARLLVLDVSLDDRWVLSADRRTLTMSRRVQYPWGGGAQTLVFERQ